MLHIENIGVSLKLKALKTRKPQIEDLVIHLAKKFHMVWKVNATLPFNEQGRCIMGCFRVLPTTHISLSWGIP
jgi:hypothetical protein